MVAAYSKVIIDHFRNPRNHGSLPSPDIAYEGVNPLCGDRIRIELKLRGSLIEAARFRGDACAISLAAASILTELIAGANIDDCDAISPERLLAALEAEIKPSRMKCALLPFEVFRAGVETYIRRDQD